MAKKENAKKIGKKAAKVENPEKSDIGYLQGILECLHRGVYHSFSNNTSSHIGYDKRRFGFQHGSKAEGSIHKITNFKTAYKNLDDWINSRKRNIPTMTTLAQELRKFINMGEALSFSSLAYLLDTISELAHVGSAEPEGLWLAMLFSRLFINDREKTILYLAEVMVKLTQAAPEFSERTMSFAVALAQIHDFVLICSDECLLSMVSPLLEDKTLFDGHTAHSRAACIAALGLNMKERKYQQYVKKTLLKMIDDGIFPNKVRYNRIVLKLN
jgi:hypothetical protein